MSVEKPAACQAKLGDNIRKVDCNTPTNKYYYTYITSIRLSISFSYNAIHTCFLSYSTSSLFLKMTNYQRKSIILFVFDHYLQH
jgi:hypothetical protein